MEPLEPNPAFVLVVLASEPDAAVLQPALDVFDALQIPARTVLLRDLGEDQQRSAYLEQALVLQRPSS
jgi:hypothetical protein